MVVITLLGVVVLGVPFLLYCLLAFWRDAMLRRSYRLRKAGATTTTTVPKVLRRRLQAHSSLFMTTLGATACASAAGLACVVFQRLSAKFTVPIVFLGVVVLVAVVFGVAAGVLGSVIATAIFAAFLFSPIGSLAVKDLNERSSVVWTLLIGVALSYFLGSERNHAKDSTAGR